MNARNRRGRWPAGLLGMAALVAVVEWSIAGQPLRFADVTALDRAFAARAAALKAPGRDVLLLGDSMVKLGLLPRVVQAHSGRSAYNLAAASSPAPATFFLLRRALESGARPSAVVLDFGPGLLAADPVRDVRNWAGLLGPREFLDLAGTVQKVPFAVRLAIDALLPSVRCRHEVRAGLRTMLRGEADPRLETNLACLRNWRVNDGALVAPLNPSSPQDDSPGPDAPGRPRFDRTNTAYVDRILSLAAARGIRVYLLLPPVSPRLQARRERRGIEAHYERFVRSLVTRHPEVTVLDARRSGYDAALFIDPTHLGAGGAVALSTAVADHLASQPGWVDLPAPGAAPPGPPPEDLDRSRMVVRLRARPGATAVR